MGIRIYAVSLAAILSLLIINIKTFNERVLCFSNQLLLTPRYMNLWLFLARDLTLSSFQRQLDKYQQYSGLYNYPITNVSDSPKYSTSGILLSSCSNFIMNNVSCCPVYLYENFTNSINNFYNKLLQNISYPIVQYYINLTNSLNTNGCNYNRAYTTSSQTTSLLNKYKELMKAIENDERKFINESACLYCIGTKDFGNFIFPNMKLQDKLATQNKLMF